MRIHYYPKAENDLDTILDYYESKVQGLASHFLDEVELIEDILRTNPRAFQIRYKNIRAVPLNRFPYIIYYRVGKESVDIILLMSSYQSPIEHKREIRKRK
jgi:toxin ParE1/3/4